MAARGITGATQDEIVQSITSFALYGFPESHAASFALLAYASAYLKAHHPAAFSCALLNTWPMGFYHPATLVKDAQRHGVRVLPIDVDALGVAVHASRTARCGSGCATSPGCGRRRPSGSSPRGRSRSVAEVAQRGGAPARTSSRRSRTPARCRPFGLARREALWQAAAVERDPTSLLARVRPPRTRRRRCRR